MAREQFDAIIIGSGQGGNPLATAMAKHGWKTVVIERKWVGGTCVNTGCSPTKTMVASAHVADLARRSAEFGVHTAGVTVSLPEIIARKQKIVLESRDANWKNLTSTPNCSVLLGEASFLPSEPASPPLHALSIALNDGGTREIAAPRIIVNSGLTAAIPKLDGIEDIDFLDNVSIMELETLPEHLLVLGGGYIALEFAQMFRRFGSSVTVIDRAPQLAEHEDPDIAAALKSILEDDGIEILLDTKPTRVTRSANGIRLSVQYSNGTRDLNGSHLLLATGRTPNTRALHPERANLPLDKKGFLQVNDRLETPIPGIYAIGDVKGGPAFTHISYDDFRVLRSNLLEGGNRSIAGRPIPWTLFTDPELGHIGLTETEARKAGRNIKIACMPATRIARAEQTGNSRGFLKAIVDRDTDQILGAAMLCAQGGELASMIQIAMMGNLPATALRNGIWSHPTWSEALNNLFTTYTDDHQQ